MKMLLYVLFSMACFSLAGCGSSAPDCGAIGLNVTPSSATADHTAAAPGNGGSFIAFDLFKGGPGCQRIAITAAPVNSNWTASDPSVHFSTMPASQVTATCTATLANPVTITAAAAQGQPLTGQASLTCN